MFRTIKNTNYNDNYNLYSTNYNVFYILIYNAKNLQGNNYKIKQKDITTSIIVTQKTKYFLKIASNFTVNGQNMTKWLQNG